ncbi:MAG: hypothetical protein M1829_003602 [Trizodia sp. TS-e1964]|nr:MAG: hypothetical protein M1829_003602 [Trizodia sp. TS-e1964]
MYTPTTASLFPTLLILLNVLAVTSGTPLPSEFDLSERSSTKNRNSSKSNSNNKNRNRQPRRGLGAGPVAGIVVGIVVFVILMIILAFTIWRKHRRAAQELQRQKLEGSSETLEVGPGQEYRH